MRAAEYVELREAHGASARRVHDGWLVTCPTHEDRTPSLHVSEGQDERVLLHCHAGCQASNVLAADGLDFPDLFSENGRSNGRVERDVYRYADEHGQVLYEVVRFEPKDFRQRRPNGEWNVRGVPKVLYRLPRVLAAVQAGSPVYVAEGEKDVHALERAGVVATTNSGGAGKWRSEYAESLRDANVVVIADSDEPGLKHARDIVASLEGVAAKVVLVRCPGDRKDVADHLAAGGTLAELAPIKPSDEAPAQKGSVVVRASDVRSRRVKWCWKGRWPIGYLSIQTGEEKLGKSLFFAWAASELTNGRLAGEYYDRKAPILIAAVEDSREDMWKPRLKAVGADLDLISFLTIPDTGWNVRDGVGLIEQALDETGAVLVFVDAVMEHLPDARGGENANSTTFVRGSLRPLAAMSERRLVATLISTHPPKRHAANFADLYHASRAFTQVSRSLMVLGAHPDDAALPFEDRRRVLLRVRGNVGRDPGPLSFKITAKVEVLDDGDRDEIPYVRDVENCDVTIRDLLRADRPADPEPEQRPPTKLEQLKRIVGEYLADGEWHPSWRKKLESDGWARGTIATAVLRVAETKKVGGSMGAGGIWRLKTSGSSHSTDSLTLREDREPRAGHTRVRAMSVAEVDSSRRSTPIPNNDGRVKESTKCNE